MRCILVLLALAALAAVVSAAAAPTGANCLYCEWAVSQAETLIESNKTDDAVDVRGLLVDKQADQNEPIDPALAKQGRRLFRDKTYDNCHRIGSSPAGIGPELTEAEKRLRPGWVISFIQKPEHFLTTRMPNLKVSAEEAKALAAYVLGPKN